MLKKVSGGWQFASENNLEDFVWNQLNKLFELLPLKRQYIASGDICDILALDKDSRLVIIELKNAEDRYIIQQLTRYYHSLLRGCLRSLFISSQLFRSPLAPLKKGGKYITPPF